MNELFPELEIGRATRDAYGDALKELGAAHEEIVVLDADLAYAESGDPAALLKKYGLTTRDIVAAVRRVLERKGAAVSGVGRS